MKRIWLVECNWTGDWLMLGFSVLVAISCSQSAAGQVINTTVPMVGVSDSYSENLGVNFGFSIPGGRGPGSRVVGWNPLGQIQPNLAFAQGLGGGAIGNGGGNFGFGVSGNRGGFNLGFSLAKGSQRSSVLNAPSLSVQNGFGGSISSGQITPFVTGVIPVVGSGGFRGGYGGGSMGGVPMTGYAVPAPIDNAVTRAVRSGELQRALVEPAPDDWRPEPTEPIYNDPSSSATRGARSVTALAAERESRLAAERREVDRLLNEARELVRQDENSLARSKFREALRRVEDESRRAVIKAEIQSTRE